MGKVVYHDSRTWFKEERNGGKLYRINLGRGSKRKGRGESTSSKRKGRDKAVEFEQD